MMTFTSCYPCYWWGVALCVVVFFGGVSMGSITPGAGFPDCVLQDYHNLGNGFCDNDLNHVACGYDGGDCCPCTCPENQDFGCGASGYDCVDPAAGCFQDSAMALRERHLQDEGDMVSFSPTSAPSAAPTSPFNVESLAAAASNLSSEQIGGIVVACLVVALILGAIYLYKRKQGSGENVHYSSTESATLT